MASTSSSSGASTVTRLAVTVAAVGAAAYAYHRLTRVAKELDGHREKDAEPSYANGTTLVKDPVKPSSEPSPDLLPKPAIKHPETSDDDPIAAALADELAQAIELDAKDAETFAERSGEEQKELQRQATVQMARLQAMGNLGADLAGGMKTLTPEECGGTTDRYTWTQSEREVAVEFTVPKTIVSKKIIVKIDTKQITLGVMEANDIEDASAGESLRTILKGSLFSDVVPDECVWEMDSVANGKKVSVTLHKLRPTLASHHWRCVVVGEPEIDTQRFGPPVMGVNGNDPSSLSRIADEMRATSARP